MLSESMAPPMQPTVTVQTMESHQIAGSGPLTKSIPADARTVYETLEGSPISNRKYAARGVLHNTKLTIIWEQ